MHKLTSICSPSYHAINPHMVFCPLATMWCSFCLLNADSAISMIKSSPSCWKWLLKCAPQHFLSLDYCSTHRFLLPSDDFAPFATSSSLVNVNIKSIQQLNDLFERSKVDPVVKDFVLLHSLHQWQCPSSNLHFVLHFCNILMLFPQLQTTSGVRKPAIKQVWMHLAVVEDQLFKSWIVSILYCLPI